MWTLLFGVQLPDSKLALGAHGSAVTVLQRALRAAGATIVVDGNFGTQTEKVVKAYQKEMGVHPANGVVNENTRFFLGMGGVFGELS
jgi:peptidoglycan hydrolase-like protein with peptidoglycan-binding domain